MTRLNTNLPSLSLKPSTPSTFPSAAATLRQPPTASRPEPRESLSVRQDKSQFQPAQASKRPVELAVRQPQAAPEGAPSVRVAGGGSAERPVGIVPEDRSLQSGDSLRRPTVREHLEELSQDPLARLRLALLAKRLDLDNLPGSVIDRLPGPITDQRPGSPWTEPPVGTVPDDWSPDGNDGRATNAAEGLKEASQDPLFRLRLAIIAERLGFNE
jgi:hypothetical protein